MVKDKNITSSEFSPVLLQYVFRIRQTIKCEMWCESWQWCSAVHPCMLLSLIIPTGRLIAFCHETYFWPGQGIFIAHNDDGKITGHTFVSKCLTLLFTVSTSSSSDNTEVQYHSFYDRVWDCERFPLLMSDCCSYFGLQWYECSLTTAIDVCHPFVNKRRNSIKSGPWTPGVDCMKCDSW